MDSGDDGEGVLLIASVLSDMGERGRKSVNLNLKPTAGGASAKSGTLAGDWGVTWLAFVDVSVGIMAPIVCRGEISNRLLSGKMGLTQNGYG